MLAPRPPVKPSKTPPTVATEAEKKEDEEASDLWLALKVIPRPHRKVPFPRNLPGTKEPVGEVPIWPLTHGELLEANAAADARVKTLFKDGKKDELNLGYNNSFANELAVQQLWRACRNPSDLQRPAFPSPKAMSLHMTSDEIGVLYNHFLTVQSEVGPITAYMSDEEYESWVRRIAEGGNADPFDSLSWDLQRTLVVALASQLYSFWTATSSAGSPPDNSGSNPSSESKNDSEPSSNADDASE
jgi:hypothetical protein